VSHFHVRAHLYTCRVSADASDTGREEHVVESDETLVVRARGGDREAFSRLVERYERPALAVAASILHCSHDASDAVQDSFVVAYERLNSLWSPRKFGAWLLRIIRQQALWHLRRRKARSRQLASIGAQAVREPRTTSGPSDEILALIGLLPDQEALVVSLRYFDDRSVVEISEMTGRPVGTVTKQLSRAYARMRSWLDGHRK
jgi:RNA polymerase sigma-70 factor (ECF subfamily)